MLFRQFWRSPRFLFSLGFTLYGFVFFKNAWVSDDAYILFRSLDQLLSGHGPRWNPQADAFPQSGAGIRAAYLLRAEKRALGMTPVRTRRQSLRTVPATA